jgi:AP endonuclease-2
VTQKKPAKASVGSQTKLSNFFQQPPNKAKRKASATPEAPVQVKRSISSPLLDKEDSHLDWDIPCQEPDPGEEALIAQAVAEADADREERRAEQKAKVTPKWNELFAKKLPPLCTVHQKPCKDFSE